MMIFENATCNFNDTEPDCTAEDTAAALENPCLAPTARPNGGRRTGKGGVLTLEEQFPEAVRLWVEQGMADPLYRIIRKLAEKKTASMSAGNLMLADPYTRDSVVSAAACKALMGSIGQFFLREGRTEPNMDFRAFRSWVCTVTQSVLVDEGRSVSRRSRHLEDADDEKLQAVPDPGSMVGFGGDETSWKLNRVIDLVLDGRYECHSRLAWLLFIALMDSDGISRTRAENVIVNQYGDKPLSVIAATVICRMDGRASVTLTPAQKKKLLKTLEARPRGAGDSTLTCGDMPLSSFYMKKGGMYSISDWVEKINRSVQEKTAAGTAGLAVS